MSDFKSNFEKIRQRGIAAAKRTPSVHVGMRSDNPHLSDSQRAHPGGNAEVDHGPHTPAKVYVDKHPDMDEYKVHTGGRKSTGAYESDKDAATDTARAQYGHDANIVYRSKRYGPDGE